MYALVSDYMDFVRHLSVESSAQSGSRCHRSIDQTWIFVGDCCERLVIVAADRLYYVIANLGRKPNQSLAQHASSRYPTSYLLTRPNLRF